MVNLIENVVEIIDKHMLELLAGGVVLFIFLFLTRSFRRSMLIAQGRARFVLENYDIRTEKIHKWLTFFIIFMLIPIFGYVKYINS